MVQWGGSCARMCMCLCVRARVRVCARACVCVDPWVGGCFGASGAGRDGTGWQGSVRGMLATSIGGEGRGQERTAAARKARPVGTRVEARAWRQWRLTILLPRRVVPLLGDAVQHDAEGEDEQQRRPEVRELAVREGNRPVLGLRGEKDTRVADFWSVGAGGGAGRGGRPRRRHGAGRGSAAVWRSTGRRGVMEELAANARSAKGAKGSGGTGHCACGQGS